MLNPRSAAAISDQRRDGGDGRSVDVEKLRSGERDRRPGRDRDEHDQQTGSDEIGRTEREIARPAQQQGERKREAGDEHPAQSDPLQFPSTSIAGERCDRARDEEHEEQCEEHEAHDGQLVRLRGDRRPNGVSDDERSDDAGEHGGDRSPGSGCRPPGRHDQQNQSERQVEQHPGALEQAERIGAHAVREHQDECKRSQQGSRHIARRSLRDDACERQLQRCHDDHHRHLAGRLKPGPGVSDEQHR